MSKTDNHHSPVSLYYFAKVWIESVKDYDSVIVQAPPSEDDQIDPISAARQTLQLYLTQEYGDGQTVQENVHYIVEELSLVNLPIIIRSDLKGVV